MVPYVMELETRLSIWKEQETAHARIWSTKETQWGAQRVKQHLLKQWDDNNLSVNIRWTKELVIDFRIQCGVHALVNIYGVKVEMVESFTFLGIKIINNLSWTTTLNQEVEDTMAGKAADSWVQEPGDEFCWDYRFDQYIGMPETLACLQWFLSTSKDAQQKISFQMHYSLVWQQLCSRLQKIAEGYGCNPGTIST